MAPVYAVGLGGLCCGTTRPPGRRCRSHPANDLYGMNGSGPTNVYAVGDTGSFLRYDGARWSSLASPRPVLLRSVWTANRDLTYIVGAGGTILTATGETITEVASPTTRFLRSVWGSAT